MSNHTEEEQIALIKGWWARNGSALVVGVSLAVVLVVGWNYWQKSQAAKEQNATGIYFSLLDNTLGRAEGERVDIAQATSLVGELRTSAEGTHVQQYAELLLARLAVEEDRLEEAEQILLPVVEKPADEVVGELARQRLARVLSAQDKFEQALALFNVAAPSAFVASREEVKGDILVMANRLDEAYNAYQAARTALKDKTAEGMLLMKLDDLPVPNKDA